MSEETQDNCDIKFVQLNGQEGKPLVIQPSVITGGVLDKALPHVQNPMNEKIEFKTIPYRQRVEEELEDNPSMWEVIWWFIKTSPKLLVLIFKLFTLFTGDKMDDSKTTLMATIKVCLGIIATILGIFKIDMGPGVTEAIMSVAAGGFFLFSWLQGLFTKDKPAEKK